MGLQAHDFETGQLAVPHGFTRRSGGVSAAPFDTLNLGASVGDDPERVLANRTRVAAWFGVPLAQVARLDQTHGATVHEAGVGVSGCEGDGLISNDPAWVLAVSAADCLPVLMHDPITGAVAAVHAGWRGVAAAVVPATVAALRARYGTEPANLQVWLGPAIQGACYQVGAEVVDQIAPALPAGALERARVAWREGAPSDRWRLDVPQAVRQQLFGAGVAPAAVVASTTCTHCASDRCYSYRRDGRASGRHWALIRAPQPPG